MAKRHDESLAAFQARLDLLTRMCPNDRAAIIMCKDNISTCYDNLQIYDAALALKRETYAAWLRLDGPTAENTIRAAMNISVVLGRRDENIPEAKAFLSEVVPRSQKALGPDHIHTLQLRLLQGEMLFRAPDATLDDCLEAEIICEDVAKRYTRTFGAAHPLTGVARSRLACAQIQLTRHRAKAELASDFTRLSPEDQALFPGLATGFAAGISCPKTKKGFEEMMRAAQQGNPAAKAPSIKEMKATIRKAGFGVADLVEKSDVIKRHHEALARLGK